MRAMIVSALAVTACSIPAKHFDNGQTDAPAGTADAPPGTIDAPVPPADASPAFACAGQPLPTTAPDPITISGRAADASTGTPVSGAKVEGYLHGSTTPQFTVTADGSGMYSQNIPTFGQPVDGYVRVSAANFADTYIYPPSPLAANSSYNAIMFPTTVLPPGSQTMVLAINDCQDKPIAGATVATVPAGSVQYDPSGQDPNAKVTTDVGVVLISGWPPGTATVQVTAMTKDGLALRPHDVPIPASALSETVIVP